MRIRSRTGLVAALALVGGGLTLLPGAAPQAAAAGLVPYSSCDELLAAARAELARRASAYGAVHGVAVDSAGGAADVAAPTANAAESSTATAVGSGPTGTNVQEAGVDEPDTAKLVGDRLYAMGGGALRIVRTGAEPQLLGSLPLGQDAYGELLVQGDRVLVLLSSGGYGIADTAEPGSMPAAQVRLVLVDVADATQPRVLEELRLDGRYLSARLSGGAVRLVTASYPTTSQTGPAEPYGPEQEAAALQANRRAAAQATLEQVLPQAVRTTGDGTVLDQGPAVDCASVSRSEGAAGSSTLLVTTLDLARGLQALDSDGVSTDGDLVYASAGRLYVATSRWGTAAPAGGPEQATEQVTTELHAFDTSAPDRTTYAGTASVGGYVHGRWALSSHEGHLRVATTDAAPWDGEAPTSSSVVVLAEQADGLREVGRVGGLGPGERIYAVRYLGDLAAVVTFRQTDPLYVLDLGDPAAPRLLGELKVPGFSTYLHPVGDDRLLGVGMEADETGAVTGAQVSLFDLSDLARPTQLDRLQLGRGWVNDDSRAFGYDPARGLALLAYSDETGRSSALGVRVTPDGLAEAGRLPVGADAWVERVLHDDGHVYAVSQAGVTAAEPERLARTGDLRF